MSNSSLLKTSVGIVDRAINIISTGALNPGTITDITGQTLIRSRVFMEESVAVEIVTPNLMRCLHEWYAAQIIAASALTNMVDGKRQVQESMKILQTGDRSYRASQSMSMLDQRLSSSAIGQESFLTAYVGEVAFESFNKDEDLVLVTTAQADKADKYEKWENTQQVKEVRSVAVSENKIGPIGELYEITITHPVDNKLSVKVPVYIQMQPTIVPDAIAPRFIDMNVPLTLWRRWTQMRAGELTFWKDFLFGRDLVKRHMDIVKNDGHAKALDDFIKSVQDKDRYLASSAIDKSMKGSSSNLANSVVIFTEETVKRAKAESGIDLHHDSDRQRYFDNSYAMIVAIVDPMYQRVTIYFNGVKGSVESSYNDFKPKNSKFDPNEFMQTLQALTSNNLGRLR